MLISPFPEGSYWDTMRLVQNLRVWRLSLAVAVSIMTEKNDKYDNGRGVIG